MKRLVVRAQIDFHIAKAIQLNVPSIFTAHKGKEHAHGERHEHSEHFRTGSIRLPHALLTMYVFYLSIPSTAGLMFE